jgi:class 3 adenylate cyclase/tetratricopeptide (TPR) repeat protein
VSIPCSACGFGNRDGARFCTGCGSPLPTTCPGCGNPADVGDRFCARCGQSLGLEPSAGRPDLVEPPAAPQTPPALRRERKQVTVLFADVKGSMDLAEGLDPEDWAAVMNRFFQILSEGVGRFGGTVDKFTGDGIMALFGAPTSQEDHARRACLAALHLTETITAYADGLRDSKRVDLHARLGLNSGEVVLGGVGDEGRMDYTALGHTVGLAQRMEALAEPDQVLLTEHTARLVANYFVLRDLGLMDVKGASEPVGVFALERSRRRAGAGSSAALVGRAEELGALEAALARAQEGQAQVVGVVGEAGVGKSRLCDEFARSATSRGITVRRAAGVSHAREVPLLPVLEFFRDYFGITDVDSRADAQEKITARVVALDPALENAMPLLFDFLEVPDPERPPPALAPDARMRRIFDVLRRATQRRSEQETLILLFEDLHWFDPQSLAFVERLIPSFPGTRTLVLTNFRPEFSPPWAGHSYYRQLPIDPLGADAVGRLLDGLLGRDASLAPLSNLVSDQTGGNPFFVEEVIRSLVEEGALAGEPGAYRLMRPVDTLGVPPTVQATLAARIDRLAEADKDALQNAAVIGRNFTEPVVRMVSGLADEDLAAALGRLCLAEFLQEVALDPVEEYRFWHALTRDVAYGGLLRERRSALHAAAARAIIATEPDRLDERAALLASHFERAGDSPEAARWNDRAAGFALRSDVAEALRRWRATLVHLASAPDTDEALRLGILARNRLIRYGARTGMSLDEAGRLYADSRAAAERLHDPAQLAMVTFAYGSTAFWRGAVRDGLDLYLEAARLADQTDDADAQAGYWTPPAVMYSWVGPVSEGLRAAERAAALCGGNADVGVGVLGFSPLSTLGVAFAELLSLDGRVEEARLALDQGLATARERAEAEWIAWTLSSYSRLARTPDEFEASLERAHEAVAVAEDSGNTSAHVLALEGVGCAEVGLGRFSEAAVTLEQALAEARRHQIALFEEARLLAYLARAHLGRGDGDLARRTASEAVEVARRQGARLVECLALLTRARILKFTGAVTDDVEADLLAALTLARETGATAYEAEIQADRASLSGGQTRTPTSQG